MLEVPQTRMFRIHVLDRGLAGAHSRHAGLETMTLVLTREGAEAGARIASVALKSQVLSAVSKKSERVLILAGTKGSTSHAGQSDHCPHE